MHVTRRTVGIGLAIYIIIVIVGGLYIWVQPGPTEMGLATTIAQLLLDALLIPTVIFAFWIAVLEFRNNQLSPSLELTWAGDMAVEYTDEGLILETAKHHQKTFFLRLNVKNTGNAIATWYRIQFELPVGLTTVHSDTYSVRWHMGDKANQFHTIIAQSGSMTYNVHGFKSNGQYALYPGEEVPLCSLDVSLFPGIAYPESCQMPYSVVTDKTPLDQKICTVHIRPENLARKLSPENLLEIMIVHDNPPARSARSQ